MKKINVTTSQIYQVMTSVGFYISNEIKESVNRDRMSLFIGLTEFYKELKSYTENPFEEASVTEFELSDMVAFNLPILIEKYLQQEALEMLSDDADWMCEILSIYMQLTEEDNEDDKEELDKFDSDVPLQTAKRGKSVEEIVTSANEKLKKKFKKVKMKNVVDKDNEEQEQKTKQVEQQIAYNHTKAAIDEMNMIEEELDEEKADLRELEESGTKKQYDTEMQAAYESNRKIQRIHRKIDEVDEIENVDDLDDIADVDEISDDEQDKLRNGDDIGNDNINSDDEETEKDELDEMGEEDYTSPSENDREENNQEREENNDYGEYNERENGNSYSKGDYQDNEEREEYSEENENEEEIDDMEEAEVDGDWFDDDNNDEEEEDLELF